MNDVTGVVLAGGGSRRFGSEDKALATLEGQSLVARVVSAVETATGSAPVVAVREPTQRDRLAAELQRSDPRFVEDAPEFRGPVAGVAAAASAVETPWLFVCGCDMPLLSPAAIRWLWTARENDEAITLDTVRPEPLHSFYSRTAVRVALDSLPAEAGLHALLDALDTRAVDATAAPPGVPAAASVTNVNTRAELTGLKVTNPTQKEAESG